MVGVPFDHILFQAMTVIIYGGTDAIPENGPFSVDQRIKSIFLNCSNLFEKDIDRRSVRSPAEDAATCWANERPSHEHRSTNSPYIANPSSAGRWLSQHQNAHKSHD